MNKRITFHVISELIELHHSQQNWTNDKRIESSRESAGILKWIWTELNFQLVSISSWNQELVFNSPSSRSLTTSTDTGSRPQISCLIIASLNHDFSQAEPGRARPEVSQHQHHSNPSICCAELRATDTDWTLHLETTSQSRAEKLLKIMEQTSLVLWSGQKLQEFWVKTTLLLLHCISQ